MASPVIGMAVNDGGASLTASPLLVTAVIGGRTSNYGYTVAGNYYPSISADATMQASLTTLVPGEYIQNSAITNPVKIVGYGSGAIGLLGNYTLSASPNASGAVGSSGSPVVFTGTTITDGGAIAPGSALTIRDQGPFITFPLTNIGAKTGTIALSGDYNTGTLGGTPSGIQVLVSNSANGPPLAGCTPCNWGALIGTISGGKWSGTLAGIPGGGPYFVSVRATNGIGYATLPNSVKVGWVFALWGQGQADLIQAQQSGTYTSWFSGLWGYGGWAGAFGGNEHYLQGPPVTANFVPGQAAGYAGDRFGVGGTGIPISEGVLRIRSGTDRITLAFQRHSFHRREMAWRRLLYARQRGADADHRRGRRVDLDLVFGIEVLRPCRRRLPASSSTRRPSLGDGSRAPSRARP